jgi:hypothetical protein
VSQHSHTARSMLCHTQLPLWYDTCARRRSVLARVDVDMTEEEAIIRATLCGLLEACIGITRSNTRTRQRNVNMAPLRAHTHTHTSLLVFVLCPTELFFNHRCLTGQKRMMGSSNACARCTRGLLQASDRATGAVHHTHTGRRQARVLTCVCVCVGLGKKW